MPRVLLVLSLVVTLPYAADADGTLMAWGANTLEGMTAERFERAKRRKPAAILDLNRRLSSWPEAYEVLLGAAEHRDEAKFLRRLAEQVSDPQETRLDGTSRLIIWERISSGDVLFEGKGLQVDDDLFRLAGRANWVLRTLTEKNFGLVKPTSTLEELAALQRRWQEFLDGGAPAEYESPYRSAEAGLQELRSPEAIEALVFSLRPSAEKERVTVECLRRLYGLESLPESLASPARLCSPDTYTAIYLAKITDVPEPQPHEWWSNWWLENEGRLRWSPERARFESH